MNGVIGRAAGRVKTDNGIDDRTLIDDLAQRQIVIARRGDLERAESRSHGELLAQRRAGIDEGSTRQHQAHDFHQHLVRIGGAVEGAGAGRMIGSRFRLEQLVTAELAFHVEFADLGLLGIRHAGRHRTGRNEEAGQMAEAQCADQQPGNDLVADAEIECRIEHVMGQGDRGRHGDDVARQERQLHSRQALGDAVAHGRDAAGDLRHCAPLPSARP